MLFLFIEYASRCEMPKSKGPCRASISRWHYDHRNKTCRVFTFGGCNPNGNNFDSEDLCYEACQSGVNFIDSSLTDTGKI